MALRSMSINRAAKAYNPNAQAASRSPRQPPRNTDGPGNSHLDYGPPKPFNQRDQIDAKREKWGDSPWYGRSGNPMPWSGPPGQERGQRAPFFTPDGNDPRNAGYWVAPPSAEEQAQFDAASSQRYDAKRDLMQGDDAYMAAKNAGDLRGQIAAMQAMRQRMQQQRFVDQGGRPETWQGRFQNENNWPRPGVGGAVPAPSPAPAPAPAPGGGRTMPQGGVPPMQNPMFEGYSPGVPMNQSKSGMGQSPMAGPAMSTGNPMGGSYIGGPESGLSSWFRQQQGGSPMGVGNYMDTNPNVAAGRAALGLGQYGRSPMGGGLPPQLMQALLMQRMGGAGMGGFGSGGFGGYNPMAQGNPFAALSGMFF